MLPERTSLHPPIPLPVLRIGVTGHRPNRLVNVPMEVLTRHIRHELQLVHASACAAHHDRQAGPITLQLLSSLAEGVDRIAACEALELGFELVVPLPMDLASYEMDFAGPESRQEFRNLLAKAKAVFELGPPPADRSLAYLAAGEILLNQCDLLLAAWDGHPGSGLGGTADLVSRAKTQSLPVIEIDTNHLHAASVTDATGSVEALNQIIGKLLVGNQGLGKEWVQYRQESWPKRHPFSAYLTLRLFGNHRLSLPPRPDLHRPVEETQAPSLKSYFLWSDTLAMFYGERSRSASLQVQLFATIAVIAALLNTPFESHSLATRMLSLTEILATAWLLVGVARSHRGQWHNRWLRYRAVAEQIRCVDLLAPLGLSVHLAHEPDSTEQDRSMLFVGQFIHLVEQELGIASTQLNAAFLLQRRDRMVSVLRDQIHFHEIGSRRYHNTEDFFRRCGLFLFTLAAALSFYDVLHAFHWLPESIARLVEVHKSLQSGLTTMTALLPALGAAAAAIAAQGEYKRLADRSESMQRRLETVKTRLGRTSPTFSSLCKDAIAITDVLSSEVHDWAILVAAKPPSLPV